MSTSKIETGAAEIRIVLSNGYINIYHGQNGALLASLSDAPKGTWSAMWKSLRSLGFAMEGSNNENS